MKNLKWIGFLLCCPILWSSCTSNEEEIEEIKDVTVRVAKYKGDRACAISYTFDDGFKEHCTVFAPELDKRGFKGTFWVNGATINPTSGKVKDPSRANWAQMKEIALRGHEISSHGWSHANLMQISREEVIIEIERNDSIILAEIGIPAQTFCYPHSAWNEEIEALTSKGRVGTRLYQTSLGASSTSENLEQWVKKLIDTNDWGIGMSHGILYGFDAFGENVDVFWEHLDKVKAMEELIWVDTFREIAAYLKENKELTYDIQKNGNELTITPSLALDSKLFDRSLTLVIENEKIQKVDATQDGKALHVTVDSGKAVFDFNPYGGVVKARLK